MSFQFTEFGLLFCGSRLISGTSKQFILSLTIAVLCNGLSIKKRFRHSYNFVDRPTDKVFLTIILVSLTKKIIVSDMIMHSVKRRSCGHNE